MANELDANLPGYRASGQILYLEKVGRSLCDKVLRKIDDGSYSWQDVVEEFNSCLEFVAGKFNLKDLEHTEDVSTAAGLSSIAMPANYMKNLIMVRSITHNRPVTVQNSVVNMYRHYSVLDQSGVVREVAVKGSFLHYQRVPSTSETLRLVYYRYPERLRSRDDKPTCLPAHLVEPLLVNYACKEIFSEIEDGVEGQQVNTDRYSGKFNSALVELERYIGPDRREPQRFKQEINWGAYV